MPLQHTSVQAQISGFGAEVTVDQKFTNPSKVPIEAVYTFPLPHDAAVNAMRIKIGDRVVEGTIKSRDDARAIYEEAKNAGQSAALLDQERPNIFTQSVANILPGKEIDVEIRYVQLLKYHEGSFEFNFPMVVGPRYTNATTTDRNKIVPPVLPEGMRTGQTIDLNVDLNAGAPIRAIHSVLHKTEIQLLNPSHAKISLDSGDQIPNKDFLLKYQLASGSVQSAVLSHYDPEKGGFFALLVMPPKAPKPKQIDGREFIFVLDQSGSQNGFPLEKSKELALKLIKTMRPIDTFNVIGFNNSVHPLWSETRPYTQETLKAAQAFLNPMTGNGGTEIAPGVVAALDPPTDRKRLRIVVFNTDGYVGEEKTILNAIRTHRKNARLFTFGIGNSVNHFLIDAMSDEGKGASETVTLGTEADEKVAQFVRRTQTPVLTEVGVQFEGVQVSDVQPQEIPDVFDESPVVVFGRYSNPGKGKVVLQGNLGGVPWSQTIDLALSKQAAAPAIEALWAKRKVDRLERDDWAQSVGETRLAAPDTLLKLALEFGIMSSKTSFVAVERRVVNVGGRQITVRVPVERVEGVGPLAYDNFAVSSPRAPSGLYRGAPPMGGAGSGGFAGRHTTLSAGVLLKSVNGLADISTAGESASKLGKGLDHVKGWVQIQILLSKLTDANVQKLKDLGFKVEDQDKDLKALFGSCDAEKLKDIEALEFVEKISKI